MLRSRECSIKAILRILLNRQVTYRLFILGSDHVRSLFWLRRYDAVVRNIPLLMLFQQLLDFSARSSISTGSSDGSYSCLVSVPFDLGMKSAFQLPFRVAPGPQSSHPSDL